MQEARYAESSEQPDVHAYPYEHPFLELPFAHGLSRWLRCDAFIDVQTPAWTAWNARAPFRIDFTVRRAGIAYGFECDGRLHNPLSDAARDALILQSGKVVEICRIKQGIVHRLDDVMYLVSRMYPFLFEPVSSEHLAHLASRYCRSVDCCPATSHVVVAYPVPEADPDLEAAWDETKWLDGDPAFEEVDSPLDRYVGRRIVGVKLFRRFRDFNLFAPDARHELEFVDGEREE